jgi:hypothetical protein
VVARRRPCATIRASCAVVSFGNSRSGRDTVTVKGGGAGSGVSMIHQPEIRLRPGGFKRPSSTAR